MRYLLDTNIVSSPIAQTPNLEVVKRLELHGHECAIGAPVWHELNYGCRRLPRGKRRTALESYLRDVVQASFPILPYDETAAAWHSHERVRLETLGRPVPYVDSQIAAIAHVHSLTIVTANTKYFARFKDIELADWSKPRARR